MAVAEGRLEFVKINSDKNKSEFVQAVSTQLRRLLEYNDCEIADEVMANIQPFFTIIEQGNFPLIEAGDLDKQKIAEAVTAVLGLPVEQVLTVSAREPFPRPDWMRIGTTVCDALIKISGEPFPYNWDPGGHVVNHLAWGSLHDSIEHHFAGLMDTSSERSFLFDQVKNDLYIVAEYGFRMELSNCFYRSVGKFLGNDTGGDHGFNTMGTGLWLSIQRYLEAAVSRDYVRAEKLEPLVKMAPYCLPLGFKIETGRTLFKSMDQSAWRDDAKKGVTKSTTLLVLVA